MQLLSGSIACVSLKDLEIGDDRVILFARTAGLLLVACGKNTVGNIAPSSFIRFQHHLSPHHER